MPGVGFRATACAVAWQGFGLIADDCELLLAGLRQGACCCLMLRIEAVSWEAATCNTVHCHQPPSSMLSPWSWQAAD